MRVYQPFPVGDPRPMPVGVFLDYLFVETGISGFNLEFTVQVVQLAGFPPEFICAFSKLEVTTVCPPAFTLVLGV